jgi:hypothetical protein
MTIQKTIKSILSAAIVTILCTLICPSATAKTGDRYQLHEDGNWIAVGGRNEFDEVQASSREETQIMEETLIANDYILITTDQMSISYEDYVKFRDSSNFWFSEYIVDEDPYWNNEKLYVYQPSFDDYMEQLNSNKGIERYTVEEIINSTVLIDYIFWDNCDAVGTISDILNDNIPSYVEAGYLQIESNINCEVKILQAGTRRYYVFYVQKNNPFLVKLPVGCYHIVNVNNTEISDNIDNSGEDTLPYNNQIQVREHHTFDNPYVIQLYELSSKYKLKDVDISNKPNYSLNDDMDFFPVEDIKDEATVLEDDDGSEKKRDPPDVFLLILLCSIGLVGIIWLIATVIKSKREGKDNE